MRSSVQQTMLECLHGILKPIVRLLLLCGIGYPEFSAVAKGAFVQVASQDYGIRSRPTNASRIAAMTGLSRKEVSRIRTDPPDTPWSPDMEATPLNTIIHYWHFDRDFSEMPGIPKALPLEGDTSFATLAKRYAGDIPSGALKTELCRSGLATESEGMLTPSKRYSGAASFSEDYLRRVAFTLRNHANTLAHNATVRSTEEGAKRRTGQTRLERVAYSSELTGASIEAFQRWVRSEGQTFIERADDWIGSREVAREDLANTSQMVGVGVYFFVED